MLLWCGGSGALGAAGSFSEKYQRIAYWVQAEQQSKKFLFIKKVPPLQGELFLRSTVDFQDGFQRLVSRT